MNIKSALAGVVMGLSTLPAAAQGVLSQVEKVQEAVFCIKQIGEYTNHKLENENTCRAAGNCGDFQIDKSWRIYMDDNGRTFTYGIEVNQSTGLFREVLEIETMAGETSIIEVDTVTFANGEETSITNLDGVGNANLHAYSEGTGKEVEINFGASIPLELDPLINKCSIPIG